MAKILSFIASLIAIFTVTGLTIFGTITYQNLKEKELRFQAIDSCLQQSSYTFYDEETGVTTTEPMEKSVERCLDLKDIQR